MMRTAIRASSQRSFHRPQVVQGFAQHLVRPLLRYIAGAGTESIHRETKRAAKLGNRSVDVLHRPHAVPGIVVIGTFQFAVGYLQALDHRRVGGGCEFVVVACFRPSMMQLLGFFLFLFLFFLGLTRFRRRVFFRVFRRQCVGLVRPILTFCLTWLRS